jgi:hypothetical protein
VNVRTISVSEIRLDDAGRLLVVPELPAGEDMAFVYRAAKDITWDENSRALAAPAPRPGGWSPLDWYRQIVSAVGDEYGARLAVGPGTKWHVPQELRQEIENVQKVQ